MTNRPSPRKSALAGASPLQPQKPTSAPQESAPQGSDGNEAEPVTTRTKVSFYAPAHLVDRLRAATLQTMTTEGHSSISELITNALETEISRLEKKHNSGKPFTKTGNLPKGRPIAN